jgi:pimeloyl-ACP methyl ester carboxylesterase
VVVGANRRAPRPQRDPSTAVALPSCGETGIAPSGAGPGLHDDAAATTAVLDEDEPTILVAHSYGGMVASQAGEHPAVRDLVYITSFLPAVGESLATLSSGADPVPVTPHADGSVSVNDDGPARSTDPGGRPTHQARRRSASEPSS